VLLALPLLSAPLLAQDPSQDEEPVPRTVVTPTLRVRDLLDAPASTILVTFDENGAQERVVVSRVGDDVFAVNGDEPGAARLNTRAWDDALEALDALE
ncbi:MAG: hypothetical protein QF681_18770, partial [Vicinamibacterales bacterium]|nr:hypothetical protein [Vicinamibacterales bacterium]